MILRRFVCCLTLLVAAGACGGSTLATAPGTPVGRPLTQAQAEILASVLVKNYDGGGAIFTASMPGPAQTTVALRGMLDFVNGVGQGIWQTSTAGVASNRPEGGVFWTTHEVIEQLPGLTQAMTGTPRPTVTYLSRPITTSSATDILLTLLLKTASTQRENPGLIQQGSDAGDATFLRTDTLRSLPIDVYHFGKKTTYWVGHDDGVLHRLEANLASAPGATVIDFLEQKSVTIVGPTLDQVALAAEFPAVVKALTGKAPAADPRKGAIPASDTTTKSDGLVTTTSVK